MGQQGKGTGEDDCTNRSAAIDAAIAGYCSAIRTIYNKGRSKDCCKDSFRQLKILAKGSVEIVFMYQNATWNQPNSPVKTFFSNLNIVYHFISNRRYKINKELIKTSVFYEK